MRYGVTLFVTDQTIRPDRLAAAAEARGFDSVYLPEHTHIPVSRATPAPTGDAELAEEYRRTLDPWVALALMAAATTTIKVGTGIALVAQHDPIVLAKQVATVDLLSGGRVVFGVGFGWNKEEMADHGVPYADRRAIAREKVLAMQALWSEDEASFHGRHVDFDPTWSWPKPVQPRVPVMIGGAAGPKLFAHVAEWADGWIPIGGAGIRAALPALRAAWAEAGRDEASLAIVPFGTLPDAGKLEFYASLGVTEVVFRLPAAPEDAVMRVLDKHAAFVGRV